MNGRIRKGVLGSALTALKIFRADRSTARRETTRLPIGQKIHDTHHLLKIRGLTVRCESLLPDALVTSQAKVKILSGNLLIGQSASSTNCQNSQISLTDTRRAFKPYLHVLSRENTHLRPLAR